MRKRLLMLGWMLASCGAGGSGLPAWVPGVADSGSVAPGPASTASPMTPDAAPQTPADLDDCPPVPTAEPTLQLHAHWAPGTALPVVEVENTGPVEVAFVHPLRHTEAWVAALTYEVEVVEGLWSNARWSEVSDAAACEAPVSYRAAIEVLAPGERIPVSFVTPPGRLKVSPGARVRAVYARRPGTFAQPTVVTDDPCGIAQLRQIPGVALVSDPVNAPAAAGGAPVVAPPPAEEAPMSAAVTVDALRDLQWNQRLILIFADDVQDPRLQASRDALTAHPDALEDRKLRVFAIVRGDEPHEDALREAYDVPAGVPYQALLVGLDGGVKARTTESVDPDAWFDRIDAMPMRQAELRERASGEDGEAPDE